MKKKNSYRWLIWIFLAGILIGVALWNILPPYIDRWQSTKDYEKLAEEYVSGESEPDDEKQKKKDWWSTDIKVEFDQLKTENPDIIGWIRFDDQDEIGINYPIVYSGDNEKYLRKEIFSYEDAVVGGNVYKVGYQPGEEYQTFIDEMVKNSDFDTGIRPKSSNKILTLSTCTDHDSSKRFAVHAVCIDTQKISEE
ncbi:MAG: class B sortase [[Ruminococcus] faecis]|nr:class B sortase [Mediterraneibacter faecis]